MNAVQRALMFLLVFAAAGCAGSRDMAGLDSCDIAQRYIDAANNSDPALVAPLLDEDVAAIFLSAESDHAETIDGRTAVLEAVRTYKEHCPGCSSSMTCHFQTPSAAYVTEHVEFEGKAGVQQQRAPLVLEIDAQRIIRILYFPSE